MSDTTSKNPLPENVEPTAGSSRETGNLVVAFVLALSLGVYKIGGTGRVIGDKGNNFSALVYAPYVAEAEAEAMQVRSLEEKQFDRGAAIYKVRCSGCHQSQGEGSPSQGAPPLDGSEWVTQKGSGVLVRIVNNGLSGPIEVKGKLWSQGVMEPVGASLADDQVADLLTYIRNAWSNSAAPVDSAEVAEIREAIGDREAKWTAQELEAEGK